MFDSLSHLTSEAKTTEAKTETLFAMANTAKPLAGFLVSPTTPASARTLNPASHPPSNPTRQTEPLCLTAAERAIALLIAEGARNHDIARQLGVSHRTVESHLSNIFAKLGIGSRVQLAVWVSTSKQTEG
jgi:DNA-binding NarL/FixJ family response regulator